MCFLKGDIISSAGIFWIMNGFCYIFSVIVPIRLSAVCSHMVAQPAEIAGQLEGMPIKGTAPVLHT
jgi:hypothetical protein